MPSSNDTAATPTIHFSSCDAAIPQNARILESDKPSGSVDFYAYIAMTSSYYTPSGKVPASAPPLVLLCCLATLPGAWIYAWLTLHTIAVFGALMSLIYAASLACLARWAAVRAKVRHPVRMANFGMFIGLAGWTFQWAAWIAIVNHEGTGQAAAYFATFIGMVGHPDALLRTLAGAAQAGTWNFGGERVTGFALAVFWLIELVLFLAVPRVAGRMQSHEPFCETAGTWAEKIAVKRKFAFIDEPHAVAAYLENQAHDLLAVLSPWSERTSLSYAKVMIHPCRGEDSYLSIDNVMAKIGKRDIEESSRPVLLHLRLPGIDPDELLRRLENAMLEPPNADAGEERPVPVELEGALEDFNADRLEQALETASTYTRSEHSSLRIDANRLCAIVSSHLQRWEAVLGFMQVLYTDEPNANNALQLATTSVMVGDLEGGASWIERARSVNARTQEIPPIMLETTYMTALTESGNEKAAMPCLEQVKQLYLAIGITDPTFLFMRQFPPFGVFLDKSAPIVRAGLDSCQAEQWYRSMTPHLDERGKSQLDKWMKEQ